MWCMCGWSWFSPRLGQNQVEHNNNEENDDNQKNHTKADAKPKPKSDEPKSDAYTEAQSFISSPSTEKSEKLSSSKIAKERFPPQEPSSPPPPPPE